MVEHSSYEPRVAGLCLARVTHFSFLNFVLNPVASTSFFTDCIDDALHISHLARVDLKVVVIVNSAVVVLLD